jgi:hypothetical protein
MKYAAAPMLSMAIIPPLELQYLRSFSSFSHGDDFDQEGEALCDQEGEALCHLCHLQRGHPPDPHRGVAQLRES